MLLQHKNIALPVQVVTIRIAETLSELRHARILFPRVSEFLCAVLGPQLTTRLIKSVDLMIHDIPWAPDHDVSLSPDGAKMALETGDVLGHAMIPDVILCSHHRSATETAEALRHGIFRWIQRMTDSHVPISNSKIPIVEFEFLSGVREGTMDGLPDVYARISRHLKEALAPYAGKKVLVVADETVNICVGLCLTGSNIAESVGQYPFAIPPLAVNGFNYDATKQGYKPDQVLTEDKILLTFT